MNKDQVNGRINKVIGRVKEAVAKITKNSEWEVNGKIQKNMGKRQADFGDLNNDLQKWRLKRT